jgi:hypothetical protein
MSTDPGILQKDGRIKLHDGSGKGMSALLIVFIRTLKAIYILIS